MKIIDGKTLAENLRKNIANEVKQYKTSWFGGFTRGR